MASTAKSKKKSGKARTAGVRDVKDRLSDFMEQTKEAPVVITKQGEPQVVMFSVHGMDLEDVLLYTNPEFRKRLLEATQYKRDDTVSIDEIMEDRELYPDD